MRIRIEGTPDELDTAVRILRDASGLEVLSESRDYQNRPGRDGTPSKLARRYLDARLSTDGECDPD